MHYNSTHHTLFSLTTCGRPNAADPKHDKEKFPEQQTQLKALEIQTKQYRAEKRRNNAKFAH